LITIDPYGEIHLHVHPAGADVASIERALARLLTLQEKIMTKISDSADAQRAAFTRLETAFTGLSGDVQSLNAKIAELQATSGAITAEDQALLDEMQAMSEAVVAKFEALDALTADAAPPADPAAP
jgi:peptidoglycan hydrolase CwlO-like protein